MPYIWPAGHVKKSALTNTSFNTAFFQSSRSSEDDGWWSFIRALDIKVRVPNTGPIWGRQDPGGPHVGPMDFAIRAVRPEDNNTVGSHSTSVYI